MLTIWLFGLTLSQKLMVSNLRYNAAEGVSKMMKELNPKAVARQKISSLVQRFQQNHNASLDNEAQLRMDFLNPFWSALGWDLANEQGLAQFLREVHQEPSIVVEDGTKRADYSFHLKGERCFFLEAKKVAVAIEANRDATFQIRRYGWNANLSVSLLSNFNKLAIYDCRIKPNATDLPNTARIDLYDHTDYITRFDDLYDTFSREAVLAGSLMERFPTDPQIQGHQPFDKYFLLQIDQWRLILARNIVANNPEVETSEVNLLVQRLLNRIIFLRVCEDRKLEQMRTIERTTTYAELLILFESADLKYNSGLFDLIEDALSNDIQVSEATLITIFRELYLPVSPYDFRYIEPRVLGQIFEHLLAREIKIQSNGIVILEQKTSYVEETGAVTTPQYIVNHIVERVVGKNCEGKSPSELANFSIVDIACGSGVFPLAAYEILLQYYLLWYLENNPEQQLGLIERHTEDWKLTLKEKNRILITHIYGVDIDPQAVEATRFSLLLRLIEGESTDSIENHLKTTHQKALPNLKDNIKVGNSLVDYSFFEYLPSAIADDNLITKLIPFDWRSEFPFIFARGGFDAIIGNPPYIRIQNMVGYTKAEYGFFRSTTSSYFSTKTDSFDKYYLFIERGLELLCDDGELELIVPNRFLTLKFAAPLRKKLSEGQHLNKLVHFGTHQIFDNVLTYTCLLSLKKTIQSNFDIEFVQNLTTWRLGEVGLPRTYQSSKISSEPWLLLHPDAQILFDRLNQNNTVKLTQIAEIFVGLQTSCDDVYIIQPITTSATEVTFEDRNGVIWIIENTILKPCLLDVPLKPFGQVQANTMMIFPYDTLNGNAVLYTPNEMSLRFPNCWAYLNAHRTRLETRSIMNGTPTTWYRFGRSQSLNKFGNAEKLIWSVLSLEPRYVRDEAGIVVTGGGNGPYYLLRSSSELDNRYLQAILSHPVLEAMVRARAVKFQGGYYSHKKDALKDLPVFIPNISNLIEKAAYEKIIELVNQLEVITEKVQTADTPRRHQVFEMQRNVLRQQLENEVSALYKITLTEIELVKQSCDMIQETIRHGY